VFVLALYPVPYDGHAASGGLVPGVSMSALPTMLVPRVTLEGEHGRKTRQELVGPPSAASGEQMNTTTADARTNLVPPKAVGRRRNRVICGYS
jgi:hypothetical protein